MNSYKYFSKKYNTYLGDKRAKEIKSAYLDQQKLYKQTQEKLINSYGIRTLEYDDYYSCSQFSCTPDVSVFKINGDARKYQTLKNEVGLRILSKKTGLSERYRKIEYNCNNLDQLYRDLEQSKIERENYFSKSRIPSFDHTNYTTVSIDRDCKKLILLETKYKLFEEDLPKITSLILENATPDNKGIKSFTSELKMSLCLMNSSLPSLSSLKDICNK